jgi:hypothetical protein
LKEEQEEEELSEEEQDKIDFVKECQEWRTK